MKQCSLQMKDVWKIVQKLSRKENSLFYRKMFPISLIWINISAAVLHGLAQFKYFLFYLISSNASYFNKYDLKWLSCEDHITLNKKLLMSIWITTISLPGQTIVINAEALTQIMRTQTLLLVGMISIIKGELKQPLKCQKEEKTNLRKWANDAPW